MQKYIKKLMEQKWGFVIFLLISDEWGQHQWSIVLGL
jgi:hypothetical protein